MQKILCRLPNWVGDVIMCLPSLNLLQAHQFEIELLGKPWIHDLLAGLNFKMHTLPKTKWDNIKLLNHLEPKTILLFTNSFSSALIARLSGKQVIGYRSDARSLLLTQPIDRPKLHHETEIFYHLASQLIPNPGDLPRLTPQLPLADKDDSSDSPPKDFILLCPFAHGRTREGASKIWPFWEELYQNLKSQILIICPGPLEEAEAAQKFPQATIFPKLKLNQYATLASQAKLVIANDSGPLHLAAAVNAPTLGLFGTTDPRRSAPKNATILGQQGLWPSIEQVLAQIKHLLDLPVNQF